MRSTFYEGLGPGLGPGLGRLQKACLLIIKEMKSEQGP